MNPKLIQKEKTKELENSTSTLQRYRNGIYLVSPYGIQSNGNKRKQEISKRGNDFERPQMYSNDLKRPQLTSKESFHETVKPKKNTLKGGKNMECLHETLQSNNL